MSDVRLICRKPRGDAAVIIDLCERLRQRLADEIRGAAS